MESEISRTSSGRKIGRNKPGPIGKGLEADKLFELFELLFDDSTLSEIVALTNQNVENEKNTFTFTSRFIYHTNETGV